LRGEVRAFLAEHLPKRSITDGVGSWGGHDREFSRKMGARGWIGMTWPKRYGGHERNRARALRGARRNAGLGAPVSGHWVADRQSGPAAAARRHRRAEAGHPAAHRRRRTRVLHRHERTRFGLGPRLGAHARGAGDGGFRVNGTKLWTSNAHRADYMILLARTGEAGEQRHGGLTQFLVDLKTTRASASARCTTCRRPSFQRGRVPGCLPARRHVLGEVGSGWQQVTSELAFERSGPERFLSRSRSAWSCARARPDPSERGASRSGARRAHLHAAAPVALGRGMLQAGANPAQQAALVKDLGTTLEQEIPRSRAC
jgi:alkylation response protein AidB-like acyl-CoA dehydrogenase